MAQLKGDRARAALVLFKAGFSFADVARLLGVKRALVLAVLRRAL